ncbi:MAG TPA: D-aminoacyl-tRNA deacylase, partial [Thermoplasmata archaeon]|nr:D-aminoacyl-tRNA deacylase [Thermoplasmata archaeon]
MHYLIVLSDPDPVASAVQEVLPTGEPTGWHVDGASVRRLGTNVFSLRRTIRHLEDDELEIRLPPELTKIGPSLVFPSIHRSERGVRCFTAHPIGNFGDSADLGGRPNQLTPSTPRLMADALRRLDEGGRREGVSATLEATHHGPFERLPSVFVEIGYGDDPKPAETSVRTMAHVLVELAEDPQDRIVVGSGGGHYAPHYTELSLHRSWAFGHIVPRHAPDPGAGDPLRAAFDATPGALGV